MRNYTYKFGFDRCQSFSEVKNRKKQLSLLLHPDRGGDAILFANMNDECIHRINDLQTLNFEENSDIDFITTLLRSKVEPRTLSIITNILKSM